MFYGTDVNYKNIAINTRSYKDINIWFKLAELKTNNLSSAIKCENVTLFDCFVNLFLKVLSTKIGSDINCESLIELLSKKFDVLI